MNQQTQVPEKDSRPSREEGLDSKKTLQLKQPTLRFDYAALAPWMSANTVETHFTQHHLKYVEKSNKLLKEADRNYRNLNEALFLASGPLHNNLAQAWNHSFFWRSIDPKADPKAKGDQPCAELKTALGLSGNSVEKLKQEVTKLGTEHFGSGWVWICTQAGKISKDSTLTVVTTKDAELPDRWTLRPLWVCDVWEHAYYLDYKNGRPQFLAGALSHMNWESMNSLFLSGEFPDLSREMI